MIRRPPRSPRFPYPALFRSALVPLLAGRTDWALGTLVAGLADGADRTGRALSAAVALLDGDVDGNRNGRSEEHTSELQSRQYLVSPLLLEKTHASNTQSVSH